MIKKIFILSLFYFSFVSCINYKDDKWSDIKKDILSLNQYNFNFLLKKYNLNITNNSYLEDTAYYYPVAIYFYNKIGNCDLTEYQLNFAVKSNSIFKKEALIFLINKRVKEKSYTELKQLLKLYENQLTNNDFVFFNEYLNDKTLTEMSNLPSDQVYFNLIYDIIKNNKEQFKLKENIEKITNYIIISKVYQTNDNDFNNKLLDLVKWSNYDNFLTMLYYSRIKNGSTFLNKSESFLSSNENITYEKLNLIKELSSKLGLRKQLYNLFSKNYKKNILITHFYGLDVLIYESYNVQIALMNSIPYFKEKNLVNYNLRYKILLNNSAYINDLWMNKAIEFINDYPDKYYSKVILDDIFSKVVLQKKTDILLNNINKLNAELMDPFQKSMFYYHLYLIDNDKTKWSKLISEQFPLSYASLTINNGKIPQLNTNVINPDDYSKDAKLSIKKVKYLLEFNLIDEALKVNYDYLNNYEKIFINNIFSDYYVQKDDLYTALKYGVRNLDLQNNNYYNVNCLSVLQKAYPMHYKDIILKNSKSFNIEPALIYAVMREESFFKKDIVSYQNAIGLMQIIPPTGKFIANKLKLKSYNLRNPEDNIKMGTYYLNFLKSYHSKYQQILSSYNAGHNRTKQWENIYRNYPDEVMYELIPIYETRHYIRKVMQSYYIYKLLLDKDTENIKITQK